MGNASSHPQNPSSTTVILQALEHNTKLSATSKQMKTCTSTFKSIQHAFIAKVIVPANFSNTVIFQLFSNTIAL